MKFYSLVFVLLLALCLGADPIVISGSNGREVPFAGVRSASPQGLTLRVQENGDELTVGWDKFDLSALKQAHPKIYQAYESAQNGRTTMLNLGVYEGMLTNDEYLAKFRKAMNEKDSYQIPKLSDFFEHKDDDQSFLSTSKSQDSNAAKRSKRFVDTYTELVREFFLINSSELSMDTIIWDWGNGDRYVIVKEASPKNQSTSKLSRLHVVSFFANDSNHSRNKAVEYLNAYSGELSPLLATMHEYRDMAQSKLLADEVTRNRYVYLLESVEEHLKGIRKSTALPRSLTRDFETFLREMKLGPGL